MRSLRFAARRWFSCLSPWPRPRGPNAFDPAGCTKKGNQSSNHLRGIRPNCSRAQPPHVVRRPGPVSSPLLAPLALLFHLLSGSVCPAVPPRAKLWQTGQFNLSVFMLSDALFIQVLGSRRSRESLHAARPQAVVCFWHSFNRITGFS